MDMNMKFQFNCDVMNASSSSTYVPIDYSIPPPTHADAKHFEKFPPFFFQMAPCVANEVTTNDKKPNSPSSLSQLARLARFNKLTVQYKLLDECGPAHQKQFFVEVVIGEHKFSGQGPSIKKAQQDAAQLALANLNLPKPSSFQSVGAWSKLLSLCNRLRVIPIFDFYPPSNGATGLGYCAVLRIGEHGPFTGQGICRAAARQQAVLNALCSMQQYQARLQHCDFTAVAAIDSDDLKNGKSVNKISNLSELDEQISNKSPISLVHELAAVMHAELRFQVLCERGPPHQPEFIVRCSVGNNYFVDGKGASKKAAKKDASAQMVTILKEKIGASLPIPGQHKVSNSATNGNQAVLKTKNAYLLKDRKVDVEYGQQMNPVSRLVQLQQALKKPLPQFLFVREQGHARAKVFTIQVTVGDKVVQGEGPNKRLAKRHAAEIMLDLLGYSKPLPQPGKPVLKQASLARNCLIKGDDDLDNDVTDSDKSESCENSTSVDITCVPSVTKASRTRRVTIQEPDENEKHKSTNQSQFSSFLITSSLPPEPVVNNSAIVGTIVPATTDSNNILNPHIFLWAQQCPVVSTSN